MCRLRPWRRGDEATLAHHANNRVIWLNLTDDFPHPYTETDASAWILLQAGIDPPQNLAVVVDGAPVGGVGFGRREDAQRRLTAAVGYWIGEEYWGRGIATDALRRLAEYAFNRFDFERLEATVFDENPASCRVLEKAGFVLEGQLRRSIVKDQRVRDSFLYARIRDRE